MKEKVLAFITLCCLVTSLVGCSSGAATPSSSSVPSSQVSSVAESSSSVVSSSSVDAVSKSSGSDNLRSPLGITIAEYVSGLDQSLTITGLKKLSATTPEVQKKSAEYGEVIQYDFYVSQNFAVVITADANNDNIVDIFTYLEKKGASGNDRTEYAFISSYNFGYFAGDNYKQIQDDIGFNTSKDISKTVELNSCVFTYNSDSKKTNLLVSAKYQ